jgi:transposase-like protein
MAEMKSESPIRPLVIAQKLDGRRQYDPDTNKRALIESSLLSGVSVARLAMQNGLSANLLRTWIAQYKKQGATGAEASPTQGAVGLSAFVPAVPAKPTPSCRLFTRRARLPNGVEIDLPDAHGDDLLPLLQALHQLPCSASTTR